jgi:hypothetical protein
MLAERERMYREVSGQGFLSPRPLRVPRYSSLTRYDVTYDQDEDTRAAVRRIVGDGVAEEDLLSLAGVRDGAEVNIYEYQGGIAVDVNHREYTAERTLRRVDNKLVLTNEEFSVKPGVKTGSGIGGKVFGRQVDYAKRIGVDRIELYAAGDYESSQRTRGGKNGYYTWPRFGCDADIPPVHRAKLPAELAGATRLSDLMQTEAGREWWLKNGGPFDATFDLADDSLSMRIWSDYVAKKAATGKELTEARKPRRVSPRRSRIENPPETTSEDEAILDKIWDRIAREKQGET